MKKTPAIFLDRDDTLMVDVPYLGDPAKVQLFPETKDALGRLSEAGYRLFIISNQSGVGRGLITAEQVEAVNAEVLRQLAPVKIDGVYVCHSHADKLDCPDRKPAPGMVLRAAREHDLDLGKSYFIGDKLADVECGRAAGCQSIYVLTGKAGTDREQAQRLASHTAATLRDAAEWILAAAKNGVSTVIPHAVILGLVVLTGLAVFYQEVTGVIPRMVINPDNGGEIFEQSLWSIIPYVYVGVIASYSRQSFAILFLCLVTYGIFRYQLDETIDHPVNDDPPFLSLMYAMQQGFVLIAFLNPLCAMITLYRRWKFKGLPPWPVA